MLFDNELAANGNHEQNAKPTAKERERKDPPESEFLAEAEKDERRDCEHNASGERFARGAGGLDDVVFKNRGTAERAKDTDGQHRDRNGSGDREARAQADVNRYGAKKQTEERAKDDCAQRELLERFFGSDVGAKFSWWRSGTPWTIVHGYLPRDEMKPNWKGARGLCRREAPRERES